MMHNAFVSRDNSDSVDFRDNRWLDSNATTTRKKHQVLHLLD